MPLLIQIAILIVSIAVLVKSSDIFVGSAEKAGATIGLPPFVIGALIVGVGTSLPEVVTSAVSVINGASEIVTGNVVGSNVTNILLALGVAAVIRKEFTIKKNIHSQDMPLFLATALLLYFMVADGTFTFGETLFSLGALIAFIVYSLKQRTDEEEDDLEKAKALDWILLIGAPVGIFFGAKYTVSAVIEIATIIDIGKEVIAVTAVALGTSLPEVMVSVAAARRGNAEMVLGNIVGSNIFNTFAALGIPALFGTLLIPTTSLVATFALPLSLGATLLLILITLDKKVTRAEGVFLLVLYGYFIGHLYGVM